MADPLTNARPRAKPHIDVQLSFDRFIGEDETLPTLQEVLLEAAPDWTRELHLYAAPRERTPVSVSSPDALRDAVMSAATERGATYKRLAAQRPPTKPRRQGTAELRGADSALTVVVVIDERPLARMGDKLLLGNSITLQLRRAKIGGQAAGEWATSVFEQLCARTEPVWGAVTALDEYAAKVMSDGPGAAAVGRDFSRFLPGVFGTNFFGPRYRDLIDEGGVREIDGVRAEPAGSGLIVELSRDPHDWDSPPRGELEQQVVDALGRDLFFSKQHPDAATRAPRWDSAV